MNIVVPSVLRIAFLGACLTMSGCALFRDYSRLEAIPVSVPAGNSMAKGDSAYERGAFAEASLHYRESARQGEQTAVAWFNFANAMVRLERVPDAMEAYRRAVDAAPGFLKAHQNLAALYQLQGDLPSAARHYQAAARIDSSDANSRFRLGEMSQKTGDFTEAVAWYEKAIRADSLDEASHSGMTQVLLLTRDTAKALAYLERYNGRAKAPKSWALMLQGDLRVRRGLVEQALQSFQEASQVDTADMRPFLRMAKALRGAGRSLEAAVVVEEALRTRPARGELWAAAGNLRFEAGDPVGARAAFSRAYRLGSPDGLEGLEMLAAWHEHRGEREAALATRNSLKLH
ncbi:MAG: tetratricopeptide repeat protein [Fibrobacterota bacterium]|nr:tetratricopeptide repeat protein [Fibrobacterota bacterium]